MVLMSTVSSTSTDASISEALAQFAAEFHIEDVPDAALRRAKLHILDAIGIALASSEENFAQRVVNSLRNLGEGGTYPVLGFTQKLQMRDAALANGTLIHGIDFDDTHSAGVIHVSASALPMALAAAQSVSGTGKDILIAYLISVETASRIASAAKGGFHVNGFHPTGLAAAFGAALGTGRLWGLSASQLAHAQGLVLSMASGSFEFIEDGAWNKRFHPGWAVTAGITSCALAKSGIIGARKPYEGRFGLFNSHLRTGWQPDLRACTAGLGSTWEMLEVALKPYPVCHFNHAFIDAALELRREHSISPDQIESIQALIGKDQVEIVCEPELNKRRPQNDYDARFSLHFAIATAMVHGRLTMNEIAHTAIGDRRVLALCDRTTYAIDEKSAYPRHYSGVVVIRLRDGRTLMKREQINRGSSARPLDESEILDKFRQTASKRLPSANVEQAIRTILTLEALPSVDAMIEWLTPIDTFSPYLG